MAKAADAFRTISEVAEWLEVPAHVLRFWESKFTQIKPVKRAGGRRYYRPADMALLGGIKVLLHEQGMTIKGAQKYLRENGIQHVSDMSSSPEEGGFGEESGIALDVAPSPARAAEVLNFNRPGSPEATETEPEDDMAPSGTGTPTESETPPTGTPAPSTSTKDEAETGTAQPIPEPEDTPSPPPDPTAAAEPSPEPQPVQLDLPDDPADTIAAAPGLLTALTTLPRPLSPELAARLAPLVAALWTQTAPRPKDG